jgi:hypothetical protein
MTKKNIMHRNWTPIAPQSFFKAKPHHSRYMAIEEYMVKSLIHPA